MVHPSPTRRLHQRETRRGDFDRGDIAARWAWEDGTWTLEFARDLVTGSEYDVQFDDLARTYTFGIATFDNAQVRHAFQTGATLFVFQPEE